MPWKACRPMDERLKFIARLLDGEQMAGLCREFGISCKEGLTDRSRRPYRHANQLPVQIETLIVRVKQDKPSWGVPKIRERLARLYPGVHTPAISTLHAVLDRHGLVKRRTRRRNRAEGTALSRPAQPNELWCADYKGEFHRNGLSLCTSRMNNPRLGCRHDECYQTRRRLKAAIICCWRGGRCSYWP